MGGRGRSFALRPERGGRRPVPRSRPIAHQRGGGRDCSRRSWGAGFRAAVARGLRSGRARRVARLGGARRPGRRGRARSRAGPARRHCEAPAGPRPRRTCHRAAAPVRGAAVRRPRRALDGGDRRGSAGRGPASPPEGPARGSLTSYPPRRPNRSRPNGRGSGRLCNARRRGGSAANRRGSMTARLRVATLNLRNIMDRWEERLPLLLADVGALRADLLGLQEVVFAVQQDRLLGAAGPDRYSIERCPAGRPEYGNAALAKAPLEQNDVERIDLGRERAALRARIALADDTTVLFVVTHLHHEVGGADVREGQVVALLDWLERAPSTDSQVVVGDFNANPGEPACM